MREGILRKLQQRKTHLYGGESRRNDYAMRKSVDVDKRTCIHCLDFVVDSISRLEKNHIHLCAVCSTVLIHRGH